MNVSELVGAIATAMLREELSGDADDSAQGTSRFLLDFNADLTAAIAGAVLDDSYLHRKIEIKLPASHVGSHGLPGEVLTDRPATYFRNATCPKDAFLLAGGEHYEDASFHEIARLSPAELLDRIDLWIRIVSDGLHLPQDHGRWWEKALTGLRDLRVASLDQFATYVLRTRKAIKADGHPVLFALGNALPALRLPRDTCYFNIVKERQRTWPSVWRAHFSAARSRRACLLLKHRPNQLLLTEDDLIDAFNRVRDSIPDIHHQVIEEFIPSSSGWNLQAANLAECEWEEVKPLFDGLQRVKFNLGQSTIDFYEEGEPDLLSDDDDEYLKLLVKRKTTAAEEDDVNFFEAHRNELKEDRKLKAAWDRFIFGRPIETVDLVAGLADAIEPLLNRVPEGGNRKLHIRLERATRRDLRELNVQAGLYFAHRYAGLKRLFGRRVAWQVGDLFEFPKLVEDWRKQKNRRKLNRSVAKAALQLKFTLELETKTDTGALQTCSAQLVWRYEPSCSACQLADDWRRLTEHPFLECSATREFAGTKAKARTVDLSDVKTFVPAFDRDRGSFIPVYKPRLDIAKQWRHNLSACLDGGFLAQGAFDQLDSRFEAFEDTYGRAIKEFARKGAGNPANLEQLQAYSALLEAIVSLAKGDRNRDLLLKPILRIGTAPVGGGAPAAIVTPWHPLRLAAMWRKAELVSELIRRLLSAKELAGDTRLFFKDLQRDLNHPLYPEITVIWTEASPEPLALSDVVQDYTLHEPPVLAPDGSDETNDSPAEGSACVLDLVRRYLALHPHERANMSVVLFNCDSARLPQAVVEKVGTIHEDDEETRCQVLLRHVDAQRLRDVYRSILSSDTTADAYSASEATQDFMAKLRISVIADQAPPPNLQDGCPYDIVFSQDVISRHAAIWWYPESADPADFRTHLPSRWSRRRPAAADDLKSAVFLCCPVQSAEGWSYLTAIATLFHGDWDGNEQQRLLPVRQLDFRNPKTARIFRETHNLGDWVVNYDELLDRRQLLNQGVRVVRYKQSATQGRNLVISSRAPLELLQSMVLHRLRVLGLDLSDSDLRDLAKRLIDDASEVSGDIVLRAAKRGHSASELIGVVLSRHLVREELGSDRHCGWYFLDDYAAWMGQREEQLADILVISPQETATGGLRVKLVVTEAKYIEIESLTTKRKESQKQLRDTVRRLNDAIFGGPERFERESWLARLSDLVLDGIRVPAASGIDLGKWRRAIREGRCEFNIRGYSHIFVPTAGEIADCTDIGEVPEAPNSFQETYGRPALKNLLRAYWQNQDTRSQRREAGADYLTQDPDWRRPGSDEPSVSSSTEPEGPPVPDPEPDPAEAPTGAGADSETASSSPHDVQPDAPTDVNGWAYPAIGQLLSTSSEAADDADQRDWLTRRARATKSALQQMHFQARLLDSALTPNSALLKFAGSANMTVDQVLRRRSELLTTFGLNVISVRPEPGAVVVAVERPQRELVNVQELWSRWRPGTAMWGNQDILIGVHESDGSQLFLSPGGKHAPHTLIAGSTGSGKSVLIQNIILGVAATNTPEQAKILLIDPKQGVDYFAYEDLPHLDGGIIDDQETASRRLSELVEEMDRRYVRFREVRVPKLAAYNAKVAPDQRMPAIWLVHDEFAEWMLVEDYKDSVASVVQRLGVKARAAGIYLVFAAQRPDALVMPMQLRANLGNRLILRVDSEGTSEIALGDKGAERLLGNGHLLAKLEGEREFCFAQVPYVDPGFADALVEVVRGARSPDGP